MKWGMVAVFAFAAISIVVFLLLSGAPSEKKVADSSYNDKVANDIGISKEFECEEGEARACELEKGCTGVQKCAGGAWLSCMLVQECTAGREVPCALNACEFGVMRCDACGQWGECVSNKEAGQTAGKSADDQCASDEVGVCPPK